MGEFKEWLKLWRGFPGALIKGYVLLGLAFVVGWFLLR
jgi:hypothetical protein